MGGTSTRTLVLSVAGAVIASVFIGLGVFYIGYGQHTVTRNEVQSLINQYSPYAQDRASIRRELSDLENAVHMLEHSGTEQAVARLEAQILLLQRDVDRLISLHTR